MVVGTKGKLYSKSDYGGIDKLYGEIAKEYGEKGEKANVEFEQSPGHFEEWVRAIKGGPAARSDFAAYAGGLAETILLGNLAVWAADKGEGEKVEWDAENLKAKNVSGLENIIKPVYRTGYTLDV